MVSLLLVLSLVSLIVATFGLGVWLAQCVYWYLRKPLYGRDLTSQERWADTAQEPAHNESIWASYLGVTMPPPSSSDEE